MARRSRTRKQTRRHGRKKQHGGAFAINQGAPLQTASGAPLEARVSLEDGAALDRPAPMTGSVGGVLSMMGGRRKTARKAQRRAQKGGACGCMGIQRGGGGSGTGGYDFVLNNDLGKVYADLTRGSCVLPQRGGAAFAPVGVSESNGVITSPAAGFGYGPASVFESKDGSAHFLDQIAYGKGAQLNGGARRSRRRGHKKQKQSRRH